MAKLQNGKKIQTVNLDELKVMLETLRDIFDMVLVVDPMNKEVWDIDSDGNFCRVGACYDVWDKEQACEICLPLKSCLECVTTEKYEKLGNDIYHLQTKPILVDGRMFALEFNSKMDDENDVLKRELILHEQERNMEIIKILASEYSSVYYIDLDSDGLNPYTMNEETETTFGSVFRSGITYSEAFRLYVDKLVFEDDRNMMLNAGSVENIRKELRNKKTFITQYRSADNKYSEMKFVKVGDDENPKAAALGFADKNEEIRKELEHRAKTERDQAVISGLSDDFGCVLYIDFDNYSEIHYRFDPNFVKNIPGWDSITQFDERLDKLMQTVMHPDDRQDFWTATRPDVIKAALATDNVYYVNFRVILNGEVLYYQAKFAKDIKHPDTNVIAGFHNVDVQTKREMEALERAETASKAKTDFLFNISHDIRTPMNAIIGFTNMAIKHKDEPERLTDYLLKTQKASNLLLSLINSILDMSRIESGKAHLDESETDVFDSFAEIESTMQELADSKKINLSMLVENVRDRYIVCDKTRCQRVFINLISNAIKYTNSGGWVKVRCNQIGKNDNDYGLYQYTVEDNGIGMSSEFQKHMFEEFAREQNSTVSGIQGTGLGLSVCKSFVTLMNGNIECFSRQGVGSKFTVTIPFKLRNQTAADNDVRADYRAARVSLAGRRVLLVDDNELNREVVIGTVEDEGLIVEEAQDGSIAVKLLREKGPHYYDVILMDIQMPIMDGYTATREIRKMYPNSRIPIIAVSANAFEEDRKASLAVGMAGHIAKPINGNELIDTLKAYL